MCCISGGNDLEGMLLWFRMDLRGGFGMRIWV